MSDGLAHGGVLVAGAINTDLVARAVAAPLAGETVTGQSFAIYGGGKGANQAVAVARSGVPTAMLGAVGNDAFGEQRLAALRGEGIETSSVAVVAGVPSGVALIVVDDRGENRIVYVPGATLTVGPEKAVEVLTVTAPDIVLATLELPLPTLRRLLQEAKRRGLRVVVNVAPEPAAAKELLPLADVVIANQPEAHQLLGDGAQDSDWQTTAQRLAELGPSTIIMTLGAAGAVVVDAGEMSHFGPPPVNVVDTTGAGDAFCGALAASLAGGAVMRDAVRRAVVAGALATTKPGAQPSIPTKDEIDRAIAAVVRS